MLPKERIKARVDMCASPAIEVVTIKASHFQTKGGHVHIEIWAGPNRKDSDDHRGFRMNRINPSENLGKNVNLVTNLAGLPAAPLEDF